jgi:hypothetical protein
MARPSSASACPNGEVSLSADVGAFLATCHTGKQWFDIGEPHLVGPVVAADCRGMAALVIGAVDQDAARAHVAHLSKGNFLLASHAPLIPTIGRKGRRYRLWIRAEYRCPGISGV